MKQLIYCYNNSPDAISIIARFVDRQVEEIKSRKESKYAGVQRNDLPGQFKVIGNKIYIRYKGKDIATKCDNTKTGWKLANEFWAEKVKMLEAVASGEIKAHDSVANIFNKFIEYKTQIQKVSEKTIKLYNYRIKIVFGEELKIILNENNIRKYIDNFIKKSKLHPSTINSALTGVQAFLTWASDEEHQYILKKNYIKKYKQATQKKIKPPYTEEEYNTFITYFERRNKKEMSLFLQFLWHTGARGTEAIKINMQAGILNGYLFLFLNP